MRIFATRGYLWFDSGIDVDQVAPSQTVMRLSYPDQVTFLNPVRNQSNIPLSTITDRAGNHFAGFDELIDYFGECEKIAYGDGDSAFITMITLSANGIDNVFLVPHGLGVTPSDYSALNLDSSTTSFTTERRITADATNVIITFDNVPLIGNIARYRVSAKK